MSTHPLIAADPNGVTPLLRYDLPDPTSYSGRQYTTLEFSQPISGVPFDDAGQQALVFKSGLPPLGADGRPLSPPDPPQPIDPGAGPNVVLHGLGLMSAGQGLLPGGRSRRILSDGSPAPADGAGGGEVDGTGIGKNSHPLPDRAPSITMTAPLPGQTISTSQVAAHLRTVGISKAPTVTFSFAGQDQDFAAQAEQGGTPIARLWTATWGVPDGAIGVLVITAKATDESGMTTAASVQLSLIKATGQAPTLVVLSPQPGQGIFLAGAPSGTVTVTGTATPAVVGQQVDVHTTCAGPQGIASQSAQTAGDGTFSIGINGLVPGSYQLTVTATTAGQNAPTETSLGFSIYAGDQVVEPHQRLMLAESLTLSNFPIDYGAGRAIQTFCLLPGEKTTLTVKSYRSITDTSNETRSVLDSAEDTQQAEFSTQINDESSSRSADEEALKWGVEAKGQAAWGWGSASVGVNLSSSSTTSREDTIKAVNTATTKNAASASAKREVQVSSAQSTTTTETDENSVVREISNINVGRTLNFVFRQLNQNFASLLHLTEIRIGYLRVEPSQNDPTVAVYAYRESTLTELDALLRDVLVPAAVNPVRLIILQCIDAIRDYQGNLANVTEEWTSTGLPLRDPQTGLIVRDTNGQPIPDPGTVTVTRFRPALSSNWPLPGDGNRTIAVGGVLLSAEVHALRTDGLIVEAILGGGDGLDDYNTRLQAQAVRARTLDNDAKAAESGLAKERILREQLARTSLQDLPDDARAAAYAEMFPAWFLPGVPGNEQPSPPTS
jgi:hypothetical protein